MVSKKDEDNLVNFLLKMPTKGDAEHIFNMWNEVYDTSKFNNDDISYVLKMINIYKNINVKNDLKELFLRG